MENAVTRLRQLQLGSSLLIGLPFRTVRIDEVEAAGECNRWIRSVVEHLGRKDKLSTEIRHEQFGDGAGGVSSIWKHIRPVATAVMLRDSYNLTVLMCNKHSWTQDV